MKHVLLLLTGTVNPGSMSFTKLVDPTERRAQYVSSLQWWLKNTSCPIVFVENSGEDLSVDIDPKDRHRVEFIVFKGNDYPISLGKGYGEMICLKKFFENSTFLRSSDFVFKATGRYQVKNFHKFLRIAEREDELYTYLDVRHSLKYGDSRFFGFAPSFLTYLFRNHDQVNDSSGMFFENILAKAVLSSVVDGHPFKQFSFFPRLIGKSGTTNTSYKSHRLYFLKMDIEFLLKSYFVTKL